MLISSTVAYLIDVFGKLLTALSYLLMKLAQHKIEAKQETEGVSGVKVYCSCLWILGGICAGIGGIINVLVLPFCDLVLLSTTVGLSIIFSNILAMRFLGEKIVWAYDLIAFLCVAGGCTAIILLSKVDDTKLTKARVVELLTSIPSIVFLSFSILLMITALYSFTMLVRAAKQFEKDVHAWIMEQV